MLSINGACRRIYMGVGHKAAKQYISKLGDLEAVSPTNAAEAKQRLEQGVRNAVQGSYAPVIIYYGGLVGVAWRTPYASQALDGSLEAESWTYSIQHDQGVQARAGGSTIYSGWDRHTVERDLRRHMAQNIGGQEGEALLQADPEGLAEHRGYTAWQAAYAAAAADGLPDELCRLAGDDARYAQRRAS